MPKEAKVTAYMLEASARLVAARKALSLSQEELANALHTSRSTIAMYETARHEIPLDFCAALFERFRIDAAWIAHGDPSRLPSHMVEDVLACYRANPPKRLEDVIALRAIKSRAKPSAA